MVDVRWWTCDSAFRKSPSWFELLPLFNLGSPVHRGDAPVTCLGGRLRRDGGPQQSRRPSAFRGAHSREISGPDSPESRSRSGDDDGAGSAERSHYRGRPGLPSPMVAATTKGPPEWAGSVPSQSGNSGPLAH